MASAAELIKPPPILIPEPFEALRRKKRIKIFFGGRDSAKTESIGRQISLNMYSSDEPYRVVAARMFMNSIDDSLYSMFKEFNQQYQFGFDDSANKIRFHANNSAITFFGISRNLNSIKSRFKPDVFLLDEGDEVTDHALDIILPTFRKSGSEIWIVFNPNDPSDAVWRRFVAPVIKHIERDGYFEDEDMYIRRVNYDENPFLSDTSKRTIISLKKNNEKKFAHIYGGEPKGVFDNAIIQPEWFDAAIDAHKKVTAIRDEGEKVASLDIADDGSDSKACGIRKGVVLLDLHEWIDGDLHECIDRGFGYARDADVDNFIYDYGGMGRATNVYLKATNAKFSFDIEGFDGSSSVDEPDVIYDDVDALNEEKKRTNKDVFHNKRAQYYINLADRFYRTWLAVEKGEYIDPLKLISISSEIDVLDALRSELIKVPKKDTSGSRKLQIMSKVEMRKRGIASPNLADMLMMIFAITPKPIVRRYIKRPSKTFYR